MFWFHYSDSIRDSHPCSQTLGNVSTLPAARIKNLTKVIRPVEEEAKGKLFSLVSSYGRMSESKVRGRQRSEYRVLSFLIPMHVMVPEGEW